MRLIHFGLILIFLSNAFAVHSTGIDSIHTLVTPVQCYGLRNGAIQVDTVFGEGKPFYYSLDGQSFTTNPIFDRLRGGAYTLFIRDVSGQTQSWELIVREPSELRVELVANATNVAVGEAVEVRALTNIEPDFLPQIEWSPSKLFQRQDTLRHTLRILESTQIAVFIRNHNGCTASDTLSIAVDVPPVYLPNVIKPGSASDAYFTVFAGDGLRRVVSLQIYSRGGSLVFERHDFQPNAPLQGWGGRWNGKMAPSGVYPYIAVVEFLDGKQMRYEGTVTLVN